MIGRRIEVRGIVQGVGFRPWALRLANRIGVRGRIWNEAHGVTIEAYGQASALDRFVERLRVEAPPRSRIVDLRCETIPLERIERFTIETSRERGPRAVSFPADLATCSACEAEIGDPADRRHRHAFTNCTACGPRFTIATDVPYDRKSTTMARFDMCPACLREFEDVEDRRFHAQPNACPECGPSLELASANGEALAVGDPVEAAAGLLRRGAIVAVKGLGGFHLACDATNDEAVRTLRARKRREEKPFAVMVRDLATARQLVELEPEQRRLLSGPERPIVLARRRPSGAVAPAVAPGHPDLGILLPYTALHHLLLAAVARPLVMTSANRSDEPLCAAHDEALRRLAGIADAYLWHDREIATRCDDSVARVIDGIPTLLRRSRGFVPRPIRLARPVARPILACGAHMKNTFCIATADEAYLGPHIGDLDSLETVEFFEQAIERMQTLLGVTPEVVAHDLHPRYQSTRYALSRAGVTAIGVQHHHAHVASAMAQHGLEERVLGIAFDGTGAGADGTSWGGEFLLASERDFERLATFRALPLAGGDTAMREVWRTAYALLCDAFDEAPPLDALELFSAIPRATTELVQQMIDRRLNTPLAHGVGRYFDAFGALILARERASHDGQVAMALEHAADASHTDAYPYTISEESVPLEIDLRPAVRALVTDLRSGVPSGVSAARVHETIVRATVDVARRLLEAIGSLPVVLTGGVFQNARLSRDIHRGLCSVAAVYRHSVVPPGDGGIALGQVVVADALMKSSRGTLECV